MLPTFPVQKRILLPHQTLAVRWWLLFMAEQGKASAHQVCKTLRQQCSIWAHVTRLDQCCHSAVYLDCIHERLTSCRCNSLWLGGMVTEDP